MSSSPAPESSGSGSAVKEMASTSNPSSEVSIEELGAEEDLDNCEKVEHAQEIVTDDSKGPRDESEPEKKDEDKDKDQDKDKEEVEEIVGVPKKAEAVEEIRTSGAEEIARMVAKEEREALLESDDDDEDDDWDDETLLERLVGLTEMFPEGLRNGSCALISGGVGSIKWVYKNSRSLSWIVFSSAAIMFMPIMIETERMGIEEAQKQQQRNILLGPGAAVSGAGAKGGAPPIPQM